MNNGHYTIIISGLLIAILVSAILLSSELFVKPYKCPAWPNCDGKGEGDNSSFDFSVSLFPNSISLYQGSSGYIDATVIQILGTGNVSLSVTNVPAGVIVSFDPTSGKVSSNNSNYTSRMTIDVSSTATSGKIDIQASGKGTTKTVSLDLPVIEQTLPPTPESPVIVAVGDIACSSNTPTVFECHQKATSDLALEINPDAVLILGDLQYPNGTLSNFEKYYHPSWGRLFDKTYPSPGNHEYKTANAAGYYAYFKERAHDPTKGYYSFDLGSWHIVSVNSNCGAVGGCGANSQQSAWLENDLKTHNNVCTLVFWHQPRYGDSAVRDNIDMNNFWNLINFYNVDVNLVGHWHNYQRFTPMDETGSPDPNGVREFVVGTGGKYQYGVSDPTRSILETYNSFTFGVLKMTLHETGYNWEFIEENKNIFDSGSGKCVPLIK